MWVSSPEPAVGVSVTPEPVKPVCDRRATASVKLHGLCTREDGLDRTRPSPGSAAVGFGGGLRQDKARLRRWRKARCGDEHQGIEVPGAVSGWEPRGRTTFQPLGLTRVASKIRCKSDDGRRFPFKSYQLIEGKDPRPCLFEYRLPTVSMPGFDELFAIRGNRTAFRVQVPPRTPSKNLCPGVSRLIAPRTTCWPGW